jgi:hypothetical protein
MAKPSCLECTSDENFRHWIINVLDPLSIAGVEETRYRRTVAGAIEAARQGDISHLKRLYPRLADFLCSPKPPDLKPGETAASRRRNIDIATETATVLVPLVRRAWRQHCKDKSVTHRKLSVEDTIEWFIKLNRASKRVVKSKYHNASPHRLKLTRVRQS